MKKVLVVCHGYLGDHLFASSLAKKLLDEDHSVVVDYVVGFPQVIPLLEQNPFINQVIFDGKVTPSPEFYDNRGNYDRIIRLGPLSFIEPPCVEFQKVAGISNPTPEFMVYTDVRTDENIKYEFDRLRTHGVPIIAVMNNWEKKAFRFTEEEYRNNADVPNKGYGGRYRDINSIVKKLQNKFIVIPVGAPDGVTQYDTAASPSSAPRSWLEEASVLKQCDYFVGAEGGLANLAGGVGCKTIIGSEFLAMLYGWRGCIRPIGVPMLGPHHFFPKQQHSFLNPFLTDEEFGDTVIAIIEQGLTLIYDWNTNTGGTLHD